MKKEDIVIGGLYCVKDRPSFYEIQTEIDNSGQVKEPYILVMKCQLQRL